MSKVRIESDGTTFNTKVYLDDVQIDRVSRVAWNLDVAEGFASVDLTIHGAEVDVAGFGSGSSFGTDRSQHVVWTDEMAALHRTMDDARNALADMRQAALSGKLGNASP